MMPEPLSVQAQQQLLRLARTAIEAQFGGSAPELDQIQASGLIANEQLQCPCACFVTLKRLPDLQLRGCIGTLEAEKPLLEALVHYAKQAAFHDPRFPSLAQHELPQQRIEISLLSPMTPLTVASEADLIDQLHPGIDGLWLQAGHKRATYLPQVWDQLHDPHDFIASLMKKAGLPTTRWDHDYRWSIYQVQHFDESQGNAD